MSQATDYKFGAVWVNTQPESQWLQTVFPDGVALVATPAPLEQYRRMTRELGYGEGGKPEDVWRCCLQHEIYHTVAAQIFGMDYSPTLWKAAYEVSGKPFPVGAYVLTPDQCAVEESLILNLQAYFNVAARPIVDVGHLAQAAGVTIPYLKREFMQRIRAARADARDWQSLHTAASNATP
jgi:hypothetical protein